MKLQKRLNFFLFLFLEINSTCQYGQCKRHTKEVETGGKGMKSGHTGSAYNLNLCPWPPTPVWDTSLLCFKFHHNTYSISHRVPPRFGPFHHHLVPSIREILQEAPVDALGFLPLLLYVESPPNPHSCCLNSLPTSLVPPVPNWMPRRFISPQMPRVPPKCCAQNSLFPTLSL